MSDLFFYDDVTARAFEPFALTRPACELRAGALLVRERWENALRMRTAGFVSSSHLASFEEPGATRAATGRMKAGSILVNARCAIALSSLAPADAWKVAERVAAVTLARDVDAAELGNGKATLESFAKSGGRTIEASGRWMDHVWDFIGYLQPMLGEDVIALAGRSASTSVGMAVKAQLVFTEGGATIEPHVHFDTAAGPVLVRSDATVQAFTRVVGPCVIGAQSVVGVDRISGCSIGDGCRVHGELSATIILGHTNKAHEGFVGHSYLGRWVNLGAGTTTSNLKNTYGRVSLWTPAGEKETELQFLGSFIGDHAKTGIGTLLTTGSVIGAGANIYGSGLPPRVVPPFAWGDGAPYATYKLDKFLEVARVVMERRKVALSENGKALLAAAHKKRWTVGRTKR